MQMRKYYGRSLAGALARVKRELGTDALIIESRTVKPGSPEAFANPGMRFEILAARDDDSARVQRIESARPAAPQSYAQAAPQRPQAIGIPLARLDADDSERFATQAAPRPAFDEESLHPLLRATANPRVGTLDSPRRSPLAAPDAQPEPLSRREQLARALEAAKSHARANTTQAQPEAPAQPQPRPSVPQTQFQQPQPQQRVSAGSHLLHDLAELKSQLRTLLDEVPGPDGAHPTTDIHEFHDLIEFGIDHRLLAPIFRAWLQWRNAPATMRRYLAGDPASPALRMKGESLREWFCHAWAEALSFDAETASEGPEMVALVGPTGSGKTTTLAKLASKFRLSCRQNNAVVLSLDTHRLDAANQWKQISACLGVPSRTIATQEDAMVWAERIADYDWVGIDTPGSFAPDSPAGRVYGSLLAHCPQLKTVLTLPATHHDSANRRQMQWARSLNARHVLFTKLDETERLGGIVNLTMDQQLKLTGFSNGTRVPADWTTANPQTCWLNVMAPADTLASEIA